MNDVNDIKSYMHDIGRCARAVARVLARADGVTKNRALLAMAAAIRRNQGKLLAANAADIESARSAGKDAAFIDRLTLSPDSVEVMAEGIEQVAALADPIGQISERRVQASGIEVARMRVPLGVCLLYTSDAADE